MIITKMLTIAARSKNPLVVNRLGYGAMRLTGEGSYGEPVNRAEALEILKQTTNNSINFIDTADYYGEDVTNRLIVEALYPYTDNLVICTKVGAARKPDKSWISFATPKNIRTSVENNLRTLKQNQIQLVHFRVMPGVTKTSYKASMETMFTLQQEGKILHVGVSNVTTDQLSTALKMGEIATVENMFGYAQRNNLTTVPNEYIGSADILEMCVHHQIPFIPYYSLIGSLPEKDSKISIIANKYSASAAQINIAWLLHYSSIILPIPGTSSLIHFTENVAAASINLTMEDMEFLK